MRYYNFTLCANAEQIKENTTINLREYAYESPIAVVNSYMYRTLNNYISFYAYREEGNTLFAVFSYDEREIVLGDAFAHISEIMRDRIVKGGKAFLLVRGLNATSSFYNCGNEKRFVNIDTTTGLVSNFHSQTPFVNDKKPLTELPHNKTKSFNNS